MSKMLKATAFFALVLLMVFGVFGTAFAAGSKSATVEIASVTDDSGAENAYKAEEVAEEYVLTDEIATDKAGKPVKVLWQKDITAEKLPAVIKFSISAADDDTEVFFYHHNGTEWELVTSGKGASQEVTFKDLSPVGVAIPSESSGGDSPKTGENMLVYFAGLAVMLGAAVAVMALKRKA
ncbi:MAG: LPXTG cell wall anchor domain-containing protein [Clostridia bacterium]|nr:LPXTG cell wall anchor domain-containing protein [Clostridia bacterium]